MHVLSEGQHETIRESECNFQLRQALPWDSPPTKHRHPPAPPKFPLGAMVRLKSKTRACIPMNDGDGVPYRK